MVMVGGGAEIHILSCTLHEQNTKTIERPHLSLQVLHICTLVSLFQLFFAFNAKIHAKLNSL
jgi:hypothetical protein